MIWPDWKIEQACEAEQPLIWPFRKEQLNPASYDLALGDSIMIEVADTPELQRLDISDRSKERPYLLEPGHWVLAETEEVFNLPNYLAAEFKLKSSRAREGYQHMLAGYCDPGWNGSKLTLELKNVRRFHPLPFYPGLLIGQMIFTQMLAVPLKTYAETGHYNNHLQVMPSVV